MDISLFYDGYSFEFCEVCLYLGMKVWQKQNDGVAGQQHIPGNHESKIGTQLPVQDTSYN